MPGETNTLKRILRIKEDRKLINKAKLEKFFIKNFDKVQINFLNNYLKIKKVEERIIDNKFINYKFFENGNEVNLFFDKATFNLIGWQTLDIYQNLNITHLSSLKKNQILEKNIFKLPNRN